MNISEKYLPLFVTVGQVVIFPYYIIWLKEASLTFTLFAWLFAVFSFSAAWGYSVFQKKKDKEKDHLDLIYFGMAIVYLIVGYSNEFLDDLSYLALLLQVIIGYLQGYFRAWHVHQKSYSIHAVHHYLLVGVSMIALSFINIVSPVFLISSFGWFLCLISFWELYGKIASKYFRS
ncbi:hypothetical protein JOC75_000288 [Metabacillus crassostreae]|uniref:hypothetical protein n=1 Tax=Metabacillus crassostreae TaxID=929098 RepID=UPI00195921C2|nr:hypothetical protein [Metabacillus crassostreae]MBM7602318.1 hypothetical protein [Metabacillus crassostreae]